MACRDPQPEPAFGVRHVRAARAAPVTIAVRASRRRERRNRAAADLCQCRAVPSPGPTRNADRGAGRHRVLDVRSDRRGAGWDHGPHRSADGGFVQRARTHLGDSGSQHRVRACVVGRDAKCPGGQGDALSHPGHPTRRGHVAQLGGRHWTRGRGRRCVVAGWADPRVRGAAGSGPLVVDELETEPELLHIGPARACSGSVPTTSE